MGATSPAAAANISFGLKSVGALSEFFGATAQAEAEEAYRKAHNKQIFDAAVSDANHQYRQVARQARQESQARAQEMAQFMGEARRVASRGLLAAYETGGASTDAVDETFKKVADYQVAADIQSRWADQATGDRLQQVNTTAANRMSQMNKVPVEKPGAALLAGKLASLFGSTLADYSLPAGSMADPTKLTQKTFFDTSRGFDIFSFSP